MGISTKSVNLKKGNTYCFDLSHSSTNSHPFFISTSSNGGNYNDEYTSGITNSRETTDTLNLLSRLTCLQIYIITVEPIQEWVG